MNLNFKNFVEYIRNALDNNEIIWEEAKSIVRFSSADNSRGQTLRYYNNGIEYKKVFSVFEYGDILDESLKPILQKKNIRDFNIIILTITKEDFSVEYQINEEDVVNEKKGSALLFPTYIYERMRTLIYEYEVTNNLRKPIYNEDGEIYDYENSWDEGVFTFVLDVNNKTIQHTIQLSFKGVTRIVPMPLEAFFQEAFFYHHEITHNLLKEFWQPWNKIVLTAPKNIIPLNKEQDYIEYSLIDIQKS